MNIRYGKTFQIPRKVAKYTLSALYPVVIKIQPLPKVLSIEETLLHLKNNNSSIVRFGDQEFLYIIDQLNLPFQKYDPRLASKMKEILISNKENILVGLPIGYHSMRNLTKKTTRFWRSQITWVYPRLRKYLDLKKVYGNASMTRLYMDYEDKSCSPKLFEMVRNLWEDKSILLIEGEKSRLGVGNSLFSNAKEVRRILGPAQNAFTHYDKLLAKAKQQAKPHDVILVAMGPTAKPLAFELAKTENQTIDIGNLDIEYEWYLRGATEKIKIEGKYTSEAKGGRIVSDNNDESYKKQIIFNVCE